MFWWLEKLDMLWYSSWLVVWTPLKNMKVNWDDEIPNIWENRIDVNQTTNQL